MKKIKNKNNTPLQKLEASYPKDLDITPFLVKKNVKDDG